MRALVTGATGFVGRYLCDLLTARRYEVWGTFLQCNSAVSAGGTQLLQCDLRDFDAVQSAVRQARPQHVYHLAALSSVQDSFKDAQSVYKANFCGALNLLESIRNLQASARVLMVGSAHVYGTVKQGKLPITERQSLAPDSPYGVSKAAADLLGQQFFQSYNLHVVRARPFNHTGPGQPAHFVCSDFARQFAEIDLGITQPVIRVGNIRARRDFSDVRDVVRAYHLLMRMGIAGEAYNISSGYAVSLSHILAILQSFTKYKVEVHVERNRFRSAESAVFYGSNRKLKRATGWKAHFNLKTTLTDLYAYWKRSLQAGVTR